MIWIAAFAVVIIVLVVLSRLSESEVVPWLDDLRRVKLAPDARSEWTAPNNVMNQVVLNYQEFIQFAQQTIKSGWVPYYRQLNRYLMGDMLFDQRKNLNERLRHDKLRLIDILRADHELKIRSFSHDGMQCLLLDYQTERRMATYHYWDRQRIHTQHLPDAILVYRMQYDQKDHRWKIAQFIQELPPVYYVQAVKEPIDTLDTNLPPVIGRDN